MIKHNKGNLYNYKKLFTNSSKFFFSLKKKKSFTSTAKKNRTKDQRLKETINKLKDNQSQLVMLIKLIEENGIDAEGIIDKWNEQVDEEGNN